MKIRNWLMISYIIVMLLPIMALYLFYITVSSYDQKRDMLEYMEFTKSLSELEPVLENPVYYKIQPQKQYRKVDSLADKSMRITLYRYDGILLYSSSQEPFVGRLTKLDKNQLYKNVNQFQKNLRTYSVKKPVTGSEGELVGFYEVTISRDEWLRGVQDRTILIFGGLFIFMIIVFLTVVYLLNRKLNQPLQSLQRQMTAFADGRKVLSSNPLSNDEIGELQTYFYRMKEQIEKSQQEVVQQQKEKEYILAALSHDLKTPLTVIQAYSEALQSNRQLSEKEKKEYQTILFEKLAYMKQLIDDLTLYATLQASHHQTELVEVEGEEFFDMLLSGYEEPCSKKGIKLRIDQRISGTYRVNVKQMVRLADNLVANAIRHTDSGKEILLAALSSDEHLSQEVFPVFKEELDEWRKGGTIILIQNEGNSIPEPMQEKIFLPFVQVDGSRGHGGSSGLGLSIAKMLIERHEGKIKLWSSAGYGTLAVCWIKER